MPVIERKCHASHLHRGARSGDRRICPGHRRRRGRRTRVDHLGYVDGPPAFLLLDRAEEGHVCGQRGAARVRQRGSAVVEFALVVPLVLALVLGPVSYTHLTLPTIYSV